MKERGSVARESRSELLGAEDVAEMEVARRLNAAEDSLPIPKG